MCECERVRVLRIVSRDKISRFKNTFIIIINHFKILYLKCKYIEQMLFFQSENLSPENVKRS